MQATLRLFERLHAEIPREEEEFPKIREQYQTLGKRRSFPLPPIGWRGESMALPKELPVPETLE